MLQGKAVGGAIFLLLLWGCAPSGKETRTVAEAAVTPSQQALQPAPSVAAPAVKVFIDPVTGLQRAPTEQEWAAMVQRENLRKNSVSAPAPSAGNEMILSDGTRGYMLGKGARSSTRACQGADGTITVSDDCPETQADSNGKVP